MTADPLGFSGKRVVVTGCGSGIGLATARLLVAAGARVHGIDLARPELPLAAFDPIDLRRPAEIEAAAAAAGHIDALFNCAGVPPMHPALDVMRVNFIGMRYLTELVLPAMPRGGAVVTVGSNGGARWRDCLADLRALVTTRTFDEAVAFCETHANAQSDAYRFSKEAVVVWTMARSRETIAGGVRLNCTSPGAVSTPMLDAIEQVTPAGAVDAVAQPIGRRSSPEEQAWALLMLGSDRASYINGVDLPVDGGFVAARG